MDEDFDTSECPSNCNCRLYLKQSLELRYCSHDVFKMVL